MPPKSWIWTQIPGITGKYNDIIYSRSKSSSNQDVVFYFGGDVQDISENMQQHTENKKYIEWNLQNTAQILQNNFPTKHILVVRPSRIHTTKSAMYSCFDNFVQSNEYGVPTFQQTHNALKHLQYLLKSCVNLMRTCEENTDYNRIFTESPKLTLIGFSKGCVVLNQILHEFHYYRRKSKLNTEMNDFIKLIQSMWWLDGGHAGYKDTWITDKPILESLAKLSIDIHVHVTPYQVEDPYRSWIRKEESQFCNTLLSMAIPIQRSLHFAGKPRSLENHFNVLKAIGSYCS